MTGSLAKPTVAIITPPSSPPDVTVSVPGSKSITNRALLLAAMAEGPSTIEGLLWADDTRRMIGCLRLMGVEITGEEPHTRVEIAGVGGRWSPTGETLWVGNAGTAARFLTAACSLSPHTFRLDGDDRMRERPIGPLLSALRRLGVEAVDELRTGAPPIRVKGPLRGGETVLQAETSSQYLSALLMALPLVQEDTRIRLEGSLPARPYIDMTVRMMNDFGVSGVYEDGQVITVKGGQRYLPRSYHVEPDASSASYFFAAAAVTGGRVTVSGLGMNSLQGDTNFVDILEQMGCEVERRADSISVAGPADGRLRGLTVDLNDMSDMTLTLAALAPFADGPVQIRNVAHIRVQESDRIHAAATELTKLGIRVDEMEDGLTIYPGNPREGIVSTYNDHRIAMAFSVLALRAPAVKIGDPSCVEKTFPDFFERLQALGVKVSFN